MKKIFVGLFMSLLAVCFNLPLAYAQIGGQTYQRVKAGSAPESAKPVKQAKKTKKKPVEEGDGLLTIGEDQELTFPNDLKECRVFDSGSLEKSVLRAIWKGECEWIVLRPSTDFEAGTPLWLQMDKPLVLEDKSPLAHGHPIVITNNTGRAIVFRAPKNGGCSIIIHKPDVAILGFTFEGAVCR